MLYDLFQQIIRACLFPRVCSVLCWLQEINYDSPRGGVSVITEKGDITVSYLLVQRARDSDSGKYTCNPSNANPKTVTVHVLNGKSSKHSFLFHWTIYEHLVFDLVSSIMYSVAWLSLDLKKQRNMKNISFR